MALVALVCLLTLLHCLVVLRVALQRAGVALVQDVPLQIELRQDAPDKDIQQLFGVLQNHPAVAEVSYVTREQTQERARVMDPAFIVFLEGRTAKKQFRDSFAVTLHSLDAAPSLFTFLRQDDQAKLLDPASFLHLQERAQEVGTVAALLHALSDWAVGIAIAAFLAVIFVLAGALRRCALWSQEEVKVERLAGAGEWAILLPFATEGFLLLLIAGIVSALLSAFAHSILSVVPTLQPGISFLEEYVGSLLIFAIMGIGILCSLAIAPLAAWLGVRGAVKDGLKI